MSRARRAPPAALEAPRLCATGLEPTAAALAARLARCAPEPRASAAGGGGPSWLHEVRLDAIWPWDETVLARCGRPDVIVCCRRAAEGGLFRGSEADRIAILRRALAYRPGYLDLELATAAPARAALGRLAAGQTRIVLSAHRHEPATRAAIMGLGARLAAERADVLKLAVALDDTADASMLLDLCLEERRPVVLVGMGEGGLVTRLLPEAFGSPWSYVTALGAEATAPGQIDQHTAVAWRLDRREPLAPVGLLGGLGVLRSPGPWVYNALFVTRALPLKYLPLPTARPLATLELAERLGFVGLSVTMPAKQALVAAMHELADGADRAGALNTVLLGGGRRIGLNTDAAAVAQLLGAGAGRWALVLGAGGAARAAVAAALGSGWQVAVCARDQATGQALAASFGVRWLPWAERSAAAFDALVHATPLGSSGDEEPLGLDQSPAEPGEWTGRTVLDMALSATPTRLVRAAAARGARTFDGLAMWLHQGAAQMTAVTGQRISVAELDTAWRARRPSCWPGALERPVTQQVRDRALSADDSSGAQRAAVAVPADAPVRLRAPSSKSITQRALICAALARGESTIEAPLECGDTRALRSGLRTLGVTIVEHGSRWTVRGGSFEPPREPIDCEEGGTTARFLAALAPLVEGPLELDGRARLRERPLGALLAALEPLGVAVTMRGTVGHLPISLRRCADGRPLAPRPAIRVDVSTSSQFASALLLVGPALPSGLALTLDGEPVSRPYLALTGDVMRAFGARLSRQGESMVVEPGGYRPVSFRVEGDWSSAALLLAAGFVARRAVDIEGVSAQSAQGDRAIVGLLAELGRPGHLEIDLRDCPDLVAPLAVAAVAADRPVVLRGLTHTRLKESDRPAVLAHELSRLGARLRLVGDALVLEPGSVLGPGELDPHGDHRIAMAFGALSLRHPGLRVRDPGCADKSFPGFWEQLERLR